MGNKRKIDKKANREMWAEVDSKFVKDMEEIIKQIDKNEVQRREDAIILNMLNDMSDSEKYKEETKMRDNGNDIILLGDVVKEMTSRVTDGDQFYIDIEGLQNKKDLDVKKISDAVSKYRKERKDGKS